MQHQKQAFFIHSTGRVNSYEKKIVREILTTKEDTSNSSCKLDGNISYEIIDTEYALLTVRQGKAGAT